MSQAITDTREPIEQPVDYADVAIRQREATSRQRRWLVTAILIVGFCVGYILSPGVFVLLDHQQLLPPPLRHVASAMLIPLEWAYDRFPLVEAFYEGYFELMGVRE